jgi:hypothetical protein
VQAVIRMFANRWCARALLPVVALGIGWAQSGTPAPAPPPKAPGFVERQWRLLAPVPSGEAPRLQRFGEYIQFTAGFGPVLSEAAGAAISQLENSPLEWGQGAGGYARRFGSNLAYNAVRQTAAYGTSLAFREDNRYFAARGGSSVWARVGHALASSVTARRLSGRTSISVSGLVGIVGAAGASLAWSPPSWQGGRNVAENAGLTIAGQAATNLLREFLPGVRR